MRAYRAKVVEPIHLPDRDERVANIEAAGYNVFNLDSEDVFIDLLTDSGTGTMSDAQWAAMMRGDEAYAGSDSFKRLQESVSDVMGFDKIVPAHQGRGAENVLYGVTVSEGDYVPNNTHFDTTRAHVVNNGGKPVDCPVDVAPDDPFQGNLDPDKVRELADEVGAENIPAVLVTITNNSMAGQPVSVANIREAREVADELDALLVIDACRFAENAYFVQQREAEFEGEERGRHRPRGTFLRRRHRHEREEGRARQHRRVRFGVRDDDLFEHAKQRGILYEGFTTYGGLAGRDLEAMAVGLREAVTQPYIESRVEQVAELGDLLLEADVPIYSPTGGHAVYVDAEEFLPEIPREQYPGQVLVGELYREGGVRAVELGEFAFPGEDRPQLVRLCLPRRTYFREHLEHIAETFEAVGEKRDQLSGLEIVWEPPMEELRHFSAELEPVE
ncbi:tryptophanase [Haladaptatus sp. R4]|uniref:tryptophanase n=1 Tax=Haladaptatus sp. R4 TaxID=1679489 RepID=UPI0009ED7FDD|nr:tryptophanase [Haladaptatus sp. R4]